MNNLFMLILNASNFLNFISSIYFIYLFVYIGYQNILSLINWVLPLNQEELFE